MYFNLEYLIIHHILSILDILYFETCYLHYLYICISIYNSGEKEICNAWIDLADTLKSLQGKEARQVKKFCAQKVNNKGAEPTIAWRKEKFFEELWIPMMTTGKPMPDLPEMNNSLGE